MSDARLDVLAEAAHRLAVRARLAAERTRAAASCAGPDEVRREARDLRDAGRLLADAAGELLGALPGDLGTADVLAEVRGAGEAGIGLKALVRRFETEMDERTLRQHVERAIDRGDVEVGVDWRLRARGGS